MAFNTIQLESSSQCFDGLQNVYSHQSQELKCKMNFSVYIPPKAKSGSKVAVMYWLSGLTCTEQNFITKSGFQRYASQYGLMVVGPDTSPRGCGVEGEDTDWDFGTGAGFYVDATQHKWKNNYRMYSYVTKELPQVIEENFDVLKDRKSISGHSMGGHGALIAALKNPGAYQVVTAFAPIANPSKSFWGIKCFTGYLGDNQEEWQEWDATLLLAKYSGPPLHMMIDQGSADPYLDKLLPDNFIDECHKQDVHVVYRKQEGYDHSYYFISTFIEDHIKHHANVLYD